MKALFLGKFQPPHVGHIMTILKLADEYDEVIVGITDSYPKIISQKISHEILDKILSNSSNNIKVELVKGDFTKGTASIESNFDVLCSGNEKVLEKGRELGYLTKFIERYNDRIYSGTNERKVLENNLKAPIGSLYQIKTIKVEELKPIERINRRHFESLEAQILECKVMKEPLIVDSSSMAVLDGSHRYAFCRKYNIKEIPVLLVDYDSELISVGTRLHHRIEIDDDLWLSKEKVRMTAHSGKLFNPRTTRHFFPFRKPRLDIELKSDFKIITPIDYLVSSNTSSEELKQNIDYIQEIELELDRIGSYINEQNRVKKWLQKQNEFITKND